jgi:hypothetical protein
MPALDIKKEMPVVETGISFVLLLLPANLNISGGRPET